MKKVLWALIIVACMGAAVSVPIRAEEAVQETEISELNRIMVAVKEIEAREEPIDSAPAVILYEADAPVLVVGETADGWYKVSYQNTTGYVGKSELTANELDIAALDEEMKAAEAESKMVVEEVERYRAEVRRSRIWGTIIVLLVVGIFATGILSTVRSEKAKKKDNNKENGGAADNEDETIIDLDKEE